MSLADRLNQSARACEGASFALSHALRPTVIKVADPNPQLLETYRETEAIEVTCRAVMEEAATLIPLLHTNSQCVGKSQKITYNQSHVCNGYDSLISILITIFDTTNHAILDVASNRTRWLIAPMQADACFKNMVTHHGQLRAFYGIIHLAAKIVRRGNVSKSLFVDVDKSNSDPTLDPIRCRAAIKLDDFYGRGFGFHYSPEMRNVLRVINIARGSIHKSHGEDDHMPELIRNITMLGWGWIYSNMVLMNNLGITIDGVSQIGADGHALKISTLRKFMNLIEEPFVAGVSDLASRDVAVDSIFQIPAPNQKDGLEGIESGSTPSLQEMLGYVKEPVSARLISHKKRPTDLPRVIKSLLHVIKPDGSGSENITSHAHDHDTLHAKHADTHKGDSQPNARPSEVIPEKANNIELPERPEHNTEVVDNLQQLQKASTPSGSPLNPIQTQSPFHMLPAANSHLANAIRTELSKIHTFLGFEAAKPAQGLIIHFHGGGFVAQSSYGHMVYTKEWSADITDTVVLCIDYKLAPEYKYPTAVHECTYAYIWALQNAPRLGTLANRIVFTGDSAGGNLAVATALNIAKIGLRPPDGICIAYPALYLNSAWSPSRLLSFFDPMLPLNVLDLCLKSYCPDDDEERSSSDSLLSPMVASNEELVGLPPIGIICGSFDPLLDDAVQFAHRLKNAGRSEDVLRVYESMPHGFLNMSHVNGVARSGMRFMAKLIARYLELQIEENYEDKDEGSGSTDVEAAAINFEG